MLKLKYDKLIDTDIGTRVGGTKKKIWNKTAVQLLLMVIPGLIFVAIFCYLPMFGIILAFKDGDGQLNVLEAMMNTEWVDFDNFIAFFNDPDFGNVMINTLGLNSLMLLINFPAPIIFAILLSELPFKRIRKAIQTVTYFPYFLSWITYGGIVLALINSDGIINSILMSCNIIQSPLDIAGSPEWFWPLIIITSLLKGLGWGSIIYIAAIAGIDPQLYEAARMDGANRWYRITKITIPMISPTIVLFLILSISGILNNGFDQIWVFRNLTNLARSEVLDTFIYQYGVVLQNYSFTTAVGLFKSVISITLLTIGNLIAKRITGKGII